MSLGALFVVKDYWSRWLDSSDAGFFFSLAVLSARLYLQLMALLLVTARVKDLSVNMEAAAWIFAVPIIYATEASDRRIRQLEQKWKLAE